MLNITGFTRCNVCALNAAGKGQQPADHLVQVEYELRQILNGVDVVMGRRRDEGDARLAAAQVGNVGADLLAWQLAALTCSPEPSSE